jgi:hypothetical protein
MLIKNKKYEIDQINDFIYSIKVQGENKDIMFSMLKKMIKNSFYDKEVDSIIFPAESVKDFKNFLMEFNYLLPEKNCIKMIDDLSKQIIYLTKNNYGFYGFDINDIIVLDERTYVICSSEYLLPLIGDKMIFYSPINKPYFFSPDINNIYELPSEISYKCSYYSLGILIIFSFLNKYLLKGNEIKTEEEIEKEINCIKDTKIYWFLKRCLKTKSDSRELLLI